MERKLSELSGTDQPEGPRLGSGRLSQGLSPSRQQVRASSSSHEVEEAQQTQPRPWDEGLTPQERADAKRRYKNRKGVERWRRRKQDSCITAREDPQSPDSKEANVAKAQRAKEKELAAQAGRDAAASGPSSADTTPSRVGTGPSREAQPSGFEGVSASRRLGQGPPAETTSRPSPVDSKFPQAQLEAEKAESSEGRPKDGETGEGKEGNNGKEGNKSNGSDPSTDEVVIPEWTQQGRMLHEFEKLGKANEAKMKAMLDTLASYAMIPHGFQRHKGRIVRLAEDILDIARNGKPTTKDVAQRFLSWGIKFNNAWGDPEIPNFQQIMNVFANGADHSTFVKVNLQDGTRKSVSLRQLSQFDEAVHKELYVTLIHQILREMPLALLKSQTATRAKSSISKQMKQASMIASGYVIGQFVSFATQRAIRKNVAVPMQGMMYAAAALGLRHESCQRLWQVWDAAKADLEPLLEKHHALEQRLDSLLVMHDISNDGSYHAIFNAVEQLMQNFEEQFDVSYYADLKCSHELLTPLQLGLLAAAQVPKLPVRQILAENIDPYTRISIVFESGVVPRYQ